jgi:hypothetical protein
MLYSPATGGGPLARPLIRMVEVHQQPNLKSDIDQTQQVAFIQSLWIFFHQLA